MATEGRCQSQRATVRPTCSPRPASYAAPALRERLLRGGGGCRLSRSASTQIDALRRSRTGSDGIGTCHNRAEAASDLSPVGCYRLRDHQLSSTCDSARPPCRPVAQRGHQTGLVPIRSHGIREAGSPLGRVPSCGQFWYLGPHGPGAARLLKPRQRRGVQFRPSIEIGRSLSLRLDQPTSLSDPRREGRGGTTICGE